MSNAIAAPAARRSSTDEIRPLATPRSVPRSSGSAAVGVRLTRRGRLTVFLTVLAVMLLAAIALGAQSQATSDPGEPVSTQSVTVQRGDTLWGIASELSGPGRTQSTVIEIQRLNALPSVSLSVGQTLQVPVG